MVKHQTSRDFENSFVAVKKQPLRMCISCREMKTKKALLKVVKASDGIVKIDATGKMPGRGAYVCKNGACITKAEKDRRFERALKANMPPGIYGELKKKIEREL